MRWALFDGLFLVHAYPDRERVLAESAAAELGYELRDLWSLKWAE